MNQRESTPNERPVSESSPSEPRGPRGEAPAKAPARAYTSPAVLSHSGKDALKELGPAQACYPFNSCGVTP